MSVKKSIGMLLGVLAWVSMGNHVAAQPADAVVASTTVDLKNADNQSHTATVEITNISVTPLGVQATAGEEAGKSCQLVPGPSTLNPSVGPAKVTVPIPATCVMKGKVFAFGLTVGTSKFAIVASAPKAADPDWTRLYVFVWTLIGSLVAAFIGWGLLSKFKVGGGGQILTNFDTKWSFKDAWASNVTVLGAILTGVLGSTSVVKAILGEDAESALALSTVGVAIAAAFAAAGPVVLSVCKWKQKYTVLGVLLGGAVVSAGALGELYIVDYAGTHLEKVTGVGDRLINAAAWAAAILLALYLVRNTVDVVKEGTAPASTSWDAAQSMLVAATLEVSHCCDDPKPLARGDLEFATELVAAAKTKVSEWPSIEPSLVAAALRASHCCGAEQLTVDDLIDVINFVKANAAPMVSSQGAEVTVPTKRLKTFGI